MAPLVKYAGSTVGVTPSLPFLEVTQAVRPGRPGEIQATEVAQGKFGRMPRLPVKTAVTPSLPVWKPEA
jgi:hypothetical protein